MSAISPRVRDTKRRSQLTPLPRCTGQITPEFYKAPGRLERALRGQLLRRLEQLPLGAVVIRDADGRHELARTAPSISTPEWLARSHRHDDSDAIALNVHDPTCYRSLAFSGSLGFGRAYVEGYWDTNCLLCLLRTCASATASARHVDGALACAARGIRRVRRLAHLNTRRGSRRNIHDHYDLSNEFFAALLDESMTYSCGVFTTPTASLADAQQAKFRLLASKLALGPQDHLLEIGCGWGGFAEYAAATHGCRMTGITISTQQYEFARRRIATAGLDKLVDIRLCDYRDVAGRFDKIVSIEMIEAVGHEFLPAFFQKCAALLSDDGLIALQAITIPDQRYEQYRRNIDFIQEYIFPGGCLPSLGAINRAVAKTDDLRMVHLEDFSEHYARTLLEWRQRFFQSDSLLESLRFDDRFRRAWDYYLCYCAAGFLERQIGVSQIVLARAATRSDDIAARLRTPPPMTPVAPHVDLALENRPSCLRWC